MSAPAASDDWGLSGYDAFDHSDYPMGRFPSEAEARAHALERLRSMDLSSRGGDGGQVRGGIQDRIFLIHYREGRSERILPPTHPVPIYLAERSLVSARVVLRHADARAAVDFFGRSQSCVVTRVKVWLLREARATAGAGAPEVVRAEALDRSTYAHQLSAMHRNDVDTRHMVRANAARTHRELTEAYEAWRRSPAAAETEICFELVVQDDVRVENDSP